MQIAAEVSKDTGKTGVYYWEPVGVPGKGMGTWFENMGMFDEHGRALPGWDAIRDFDQKNPPIKELDKYIESLYEYEETPEVEDFMKLLMIHGNLISNPEFKDGLIIGRLRQASKKDSIHWVRMECLSLRMPILTIR